MTGNDKFSSIVCFILLGHTMWSAVLCSIEIKAVKADFKNLGFYFF